MHSGCIRPHHHILCRILPKDWWEYRLKRISLEKLQERLKTYGFAKVNRSHLINMSHIKSVQGKTLELDNGYTTEMSRSIHKQIKRAIMTENINT